MEIRRSLRDTSARDKKSRETLVDTSRRTSETVDGNANYVRYAIPLRGGVTLVVFHREEIEQRLLKVLVSSVVVAKELRREVTLILSCTEAPSKHLARRCCSVREQTTVRNRNCLLQFATTGKFIRLKPPPPRRPLSFRAARSRRVLFDKFLSWPLPEELGSVDGDLPSYSPLSRQGPDKGASHRTKS